jgi:hypothetical protein
MLKTITRVRSVKNRNGISNGTVFFGVHLGKRSFYIEKPNAIRKMNVSIKDKYGYATVK